MDPLGYLTLVEDGFPRIQGVLKGYDGVALGQGSAPPPRELHGIAGCFFLVKSPCVGDRKLPFFSWIFPWKMVIFHSYLSLPEGNYCHPQFLEKEILSGNQPWQWNSSPFSMIFPPFLHRIFQIFQLAMFDYQIQNEATKSVLHVTLPDGLVCWLHLPRLWAAVEDADGPLPENTG